MPREFRRRAPLPFLHGEGLGVGLSAAVMHKRREVCSGDSLTPPRKERGGEKTA